MKKTTIISIAVGIAAAAYLMTRRQVQSSTAYGTSHLKGLDEGLTLAPQQAQLWGSMPAIYPGTSTVYAPKQTGIAATLPYGFNNATPTGEVINGFV